jgi:hypothetical protein
MCGSPEAPLLVELISQVKAGGKTELAALLSYLKRVKESCPSLWEEAQLQGSAHLPACNAQSSVRDMRWAMRWKGRCMLHFKKQMDQLQVAISCEPCWFACHCR